MPKGMEVRRVQLMEMHVTMIDIPKGADVLEQLNKAADDAGYVPFVVQSAIGKLSAATLRIPNDDALDEAKSVESIFNVKVVEDFEKDPKYRDMPIVPVEGLTLEDLPPDFPHPSLREKKPHWSSIQSFDYPLTLLYAIGGRRRPTSSFKHHVYCRDLPQVTEVFQKISLASFYQDVSQEVLCNSLLGSQRHMIHLYKHGRYRSSQVTMWSTRSRFSLEPDKILEKASSTLRMEGSY